MNFTLNEDQTDAIIKMWGELHPEDQGKAIFSLRFRERATQGKFAIMKKRDQTNVVPGEDSTKRYNQGVCCVKLCM